MSTGEEHEEKQVCRCVERLFVWQTGKASVACKDTMPADLSSDTWAIPGPLESDTIL